MLSDSRGKVHLTYNSNTAMKDKNTLTKQMLPQ